MLHRLLLVSRRLRIRSYNYGDELIYTSEAYHIGPTVDLVIFACLNFREFLILWLFTKFRIREF